MKINCNKCNTPKEKKDFYKSIQKSNGLDSTCIECRSEINKQRAAKKSNERKSYRDFFGF
jgi:hypothetical protein